MFGRDPMLNIAHDTNWKLIKHKKKKLIKAQNQRENRSRKEHTYKRVTALLSKMTNRPNMVKQHMIVHTLSHQQEIMVCYKHVSIL